MHRAAAVLIVMVLVAVSTAPALADAPVILPSLTQALRTGAESRGSAYAGDCGSTVSPRDVGKSCTKFVEEQGTMRAYLIGQTFSEFRSWLFVQNGPNGWSFVGSAPLNDRASPSSVPWPKSSLPSH